jgi:glucan phosphoethanolaminetransferase (alkaline phosphatase superfamily)
MTANGVIDVLVSSTRVGWTAAAAPRRRATAAVRSDIVNVMRRWSAENSANSYFNIFTFKITFAILIVNVFIQSKYSENWLFQLRINMKKACVALLVLAVATAQVVSSLRLLPRADPQQNAAAAVC